MYGLHTRDRSLFALRIANFSLVALRISLHLLLRAPFPSSTLECYASIRSALCPSSNNDARLLFAGSPGCSRSGCDPRSRSSYRLLTTYPADLSELMR